MGDQRISEFFGKFPPVVCQEVLTARTVCTGHRLVFLPVFSVPLRSGPRSGEAWRLEALVQVERQGPLRLYKNNGGISHDFLKNPPVGWVFNRSDH